MWKVLFILLPIVALAPMAQALEVVLAAEIDSSIFAESPSNSAGAGPYIFSGVTSDRAGNEFYLRRGLIQFDVAAALPANAVIQSAALQLTIAKVPDEKFEGTSQSIHRVTSEWDAPTAPGSGTTGPPGRGTTAVANDATWSSNLFGTSSWTTAGGDFHAAASATVGVSPIVNQVTVWSSTGTANDVQLWLDDPSQNFGWILIGNESDVLSFNKNARGYYSADNADLAAEGNRPRLVINYTVVPEPAAMSLLLCLSVLGISIHRKISI